MTASSAAPHHGPWAIVLAGGEGSRLRPLIDRMYTDGRPKQYASLIGSRSLLRTSLDRVSLFVPAARTVVVTVERHRHHASVELAGGGYHLLEQPASRGTAAGALWPMLWIAERDPDATVVVVPSDHHVSDDARFRDCILELVALAQAEPDRIFLLGVRPTAPESGYGWIEPGAAIGPAGVQPVYSVRRFLEKPPEAMARTMLRRGWLWNTLIIVGRVGGLIDAARVHLPQLCRPLARAVGASRGETASLVLREVYGALPSADLSRDLLELIPQRLGVAQLAELDWSDLGTQARVLAAWRALGTEPDWAGETSAADDQTGSSPTQATMSASPAARRRLGSVADAVVERAGD